MVCESDSQVVNVAAIQDDMTALNERFDAVRSGVEREKKDLDCVIANVEQFEGALSQFESWLPEAMAAVQRFEPISSEPEELKRQLKEVEVRSLFLPINTDFLTKPRRYLSGKFQCFIPI